MAFIRWKTNRTGGSQAYLVQSYRENGKSKQRTLAYLGDAAALTPEHVADLKKRYPDQSIDWDAIKPRQRPLTDPQTLSDADLLRKMRHLRLERGLKTYHVAWKLRDAGLKDFNQNNLTALEKEFAGVKTPSRPKDPDFVSALRLIFKLPNVVPPAAKSEAVVPRNPQHVGVFSAPQPPKHVSTSNFPPQSGEARLEGGPPQNDADPIKKMEEAFFQALLTKNTAALRDLLAHDFILVDVFKGLEIDKGAFLAVLESGQLKFDKIERSGSKIRRYKETSIVVGETHMSGHFNESSFTVKSRYTHVYVHLAGLWLMVSAQGTPIQSSLTVVSDGVDGN